MTGYSDFAELLARFPDLLMLRKFDRLSIQILLYKQAELSYLERDLRNIVSWDISSPDAADIHQCWKSMNDAFDDGSAQFQKDKVDQIETKLKDYRVNSSRPPSLALTACTDESILRMTQMQKLEKPSTYRHDSVNDWLGRSNGGDNFLQFCEADPWKSMNKFDLISLYTEGDRLDQWLVKSLVPTYHRLIGHRKKPDIESKSNIGPVWEYKTTYFAALGTLISVSLSCAVPIISIIILYTASNTHLRIGLISLFTIIFSITLAIVTGCRRAEIFAATAAFAAVQVVFLQGVSSV